MTDFAGMTVIHKDDFRTACKRWQEVVTHAGGQKAFENFIGMSVKRIEEGSGQFSLVFKKTRDRIELLLTSNYRTIIKMHEARKRKRA